MTRRLFPLIAVLVMLVLATIGAAGGFALTRTAQAAVAQQPSTPGQAAAQAPMHPLPPELAFLQGMTSTQRFDHYLGTQTGFVNPQGQNVYLNSIPGKVSTISASSLTITPNGSTQTRTFNITSNTWVVSRPHQGALSAFSPGDRVIVYVINNGNDAVAITGP